ncbi:MAG TPA: hypothetical protein VNZ54_11780 [bacterium]|nr:hypothetical protein [bacterium]
MPAAAKIKNLDALTEEQLLELRLCDLDLSFAGSGVETSVGQLYRDLDAKGLRLRPPCYIGDEWFTPDGVAAIAVPFYLFHPRLLQLEKKMMLSAEGAAPEDCLRLLRHECGHSFVHAYHLTHRPDWVERFGSPQAELKDFYHFRPYSRSYVRHLKDWYAQSHPEEDFAETFAVWLDPASDWRKRYARWPALKKLEYVDQLMAELKGPVKAAHKKDLSYQAAALKRKLSTHYQQRRSFYAEEGEDYYDADLKVLFSAGSEGVPAARWILKAGRVLDKSVGDWAHVTRFTVRRLRVRLLNRCRALGLRMAKDNEAAKLGFTAYLSTVIGNYVFTSRFKRRP